MSIWAKIAKYGGSALKGAGMSAAGKTDHTVCGQYAGCCGHGGIYRSEPSG